MEGVAKGGGKKREKGRLNCPRISASKIFLIFSRKSTSLLSVFIFCLFRRKNTSFASFIKPQIKRISLV